MWVKHAEDPLAVLRAEFIAGEDAALDPENDTAPTSGLATTTLQSPWLHQRCQVCGHTFRRGDSVRIEVGGPIVHTDPALPCAGGGQVEDLIPQAGAFFDGLDETWPPPKDLQILRLDEDHFLVAPPRAGFRRRTCVVCGHTFRSLDHVVLCPCFPDAPACQAAIHRDPVHGLHCFDDWNPGAFKLHCPATSRQLDG